MSRRPARFRESDLRRAIRAAEKEGARMSVEILPDGTIKLVRNENLGAQPTYTNRRIPL